MHDFAETEMLAVEGDRGVDIADDVANLHGGHNACSFRNLRIQRARSWCPRAGSNNSIGLPNGSSSSTCLTAAPLGLSSRKWTPAPRRLSMVASRSAT